MLRARTTSGPEPADLGLVRAAKASPDEFAEIYRLYQARVYRYLATRASGPDEAADLTQTVFLRAFHGLRSYRGPSLAGWLFGIARNAAVDAHRRRRPALPWEAAPETGNGRSPEDEAIQNERLESLRALIADLDTYQRDLLALRFAGELSAREIAPLVGRSEAAVKKQLTRTISNLREQYRDEPS